MEHKFEQIAFGPNGVYVEEYVDAQAEVPSVVEESHG